MAREPRKLAGIGASDLPNAAAFDAYVGPAREVTVDPLRGIIALHDGSTPGGKRFLRTSDIGEEVIGYTELLNEFANMQIGDDGDVIRLINGKPTFVAYEAPNRIFNNRAEAEALSPVTPPRTIETLGYHSRGDGGRAMYAKVDAEPAHAGKLMITLQNGSVSWYEVIL